MGVRRGVSADGGQHPVSAPAAWERNLAFAVAVHDVIVAGDRLLGRVSPAHERARKAVVDVIDAALADGVSERSIDAALARLRAGGEG